MFSQLPNLLTLLRIAACPVLVVLLYEHRYDTALVLFIVTGLTDGLDGFIAKRYHYATRLGAVLDPVADKLLAAIAYIMLVILGHIPFWLLVAVVFRDLIIVSGYLLLVGMGDEVPMRPTRISKTNTFLQITLVVVVLGRLAGWIGVPPMVEQLLWAGVLITTVASGAQYVWVWGVRRERIK